MSQKPARFGGYVPSQAEAVKSIQQMLDRERQRLSLEDWLSLPARLGMLDPSSGAIAAALIDSRTSTLEDHCQKVGTTPAEFMAEALQQPVVIEALRRHLERG